MAKYTEHLRLVKPEGNEYYNVEQFNHNAELIDEETKKLSEDLAKVQEGATREKAGIVQFGTEEGKALEGMMLARIFGCVGYGGDIQDSGVKDINYIYYDRNTRKMYKCLNQNSDVSANVANFVPLDNNSLLERLENFYTYREFNNYAQIKDVTSITARVYTVGNLAITSIMVETPKLIGKTTIKFPIKYKALPFVTFQDNDTASTPPGPLGINWTNLDSIEVQGFNGGFTMLVVGAI